MDGVPAGNVGDGAALFCLGVVAGRVRSSVGFSVGRGGNGTALFRPRPVAGRGGSLVTEGCGGEAFCGPRLVDGGGGASIGKGDAVAVKIGGCTCVARLAAARVKVTISTA